VSAASSRARSARRIAAALAVAGLVVPLAGCTLTAAGREENRRVAVSVGRLDPAAFGAADIACADVPWIGEDVVERFFRCWSLPLGDGLTRQTAVAIADALAAESGGVNDGEGCGTVDEAAGVLGEVQCASFASMPQARDANVEIWVALADDAVEALAPGTTAGEYFVTFRLVAYGPERYQPEG